MFVQLIRRKQGERYSKGARHCVHVFKHSPASPCTYLSISNVTLHVLVPCGLTPSVAQCSY